VPEYIEQLSGGLPAVAVVTDELLKAPVMLLDVTLQSLASCHKHMRQYRTQQLPHPAACT